MYGWHKTVDKTLIYDEWYIVVQFEFDVHTTHTHTLARTLTHMLVALGTHLVSRQEIFIQIPNRLE